MSAHDQLKRQAAVDVALVTLDRYGCIYVGDDVAVQLEAARKEVQRYHGVACTTEACDPGFAGQPGCAFTADADTG